MTDGDAVWSNGKGQLAPPLSDLVGIVEREPDQTPSLFAERTQPF
jgi:hypothetical protein